MSGLRCCVILADAREQLKFGMPEYRIYTVVDDEKSYLGSCRIIQSVDDHEAIRAAKRFLDFHELQIWEQGRFVARLYPIEH
jgi:hypothetical protein